jgi:uncharacterized protein YndB with AHSA1/START domain
MEYMKITIETTIAAGVDKVWEYYTNPAHITQWNFANNDWCCPKAENDLQVGGKYNARMEAKDGSFGFDFEAIYDEVTEGKKLSYTMGDGRQATTSFEGGNGTTKVTTTFDAESVHDAEMQRAGWQAILENFKKHVESN